MSRRLYILDFDRTIFDTDRFFGDMLAALQRTHRLDLDAFSNTFSAFIDPEQGGYDPHQHHRQLLGLAPDELDEAIKAELGDKDYTFPDAALWLLTRLTDQDDVIIMTVGRQRYQELKFHHAKTVDGIRKIVVGTNKGEIIRRLLEGNTSRGIDIFDKMYENITLIDDSAETFTKLGSTSKVSGIRIARPGQRYSDLLTPTGTRHITSFGDIV